MSSVAEDDLSGGLETGAGRLVAAGIESASRKRMTPILFVRIPVPTPSPLEGEGWGGGSSVATLK